MQDIVSRRLRFYKHKYGGAVRSFIWYYAGDRDLFGFLNQPGVHLVVHATETQEVLCTHPASEWALARLRGFDSIFHLPGGGIDPGENFKRALFRESNEELGEKTGLGNLFSDAEISERTVSFGKLRNPVTFVRIKVRKPSDFCVRNPGLGTEFLYRHTWQRLGTREFKRRTNACMEAGLRAFKLW